MDKYAELGTEVEVSQIDGELKKLWEQDDASTNASLMNLVIFTEKEGGLLENSLIISDLTKENACRAILVEIQSAAEPSIRAWITAQCHLAGGKKSICCEQISFLLTGRVTGRFRNTVFSHLNSDLPLIFWWQGELSSIFSERLASALDRMIVDSSSWQNPKESFACITEALGDDSKVVVQDLAWTRCWQFRASVAGLFDDCVAQKILGGIEKVKIVHHPLNRGTALMMLSWLAVQAGWTHAGDMDFESKGGTKITVELEPKEDSAPLSVVEISAGATVVCVSRENNSTHLMREIHSADYNVQSLSPADPQTSVDLVKEQLARGGKNSLFLKILPLYLELV